MSFVFDEKNATNSLGETSWASGNKTTFKENFKASYDAMFASDRFDSEKNSIQKEYSLLTDFLNKKGYTQFSNPIYNNEDVPLGPEDPRVLDEPPPSETENIEAKKDLANSFYNLDISIDTIAKQMMSMDTPKYARLELEQEEAIKKITEWTK